MSELAIKSPVLTAFHIKVLAALLMLVDHVGFVYEVEGLRVVGRFSFPLFVWLLSQGARQTRNWHRYQQRLLILAIATQPILALFRHTLLPLNPVFQLWLGLILVRLIEQRRMTLSLWASILGVATCFFDYQYYGIGMVYLISSYPYLLPNAAEQLDWKVNILLWIAVFALVHFLYVPLYPLQIFALPFIGLLPVLNMIQQRGPKARWFYWFYPLHFIPLILLQ